FDSTLEKKKPVIICIGAGMLLKAIDSALIERKVGDEFELELKPEEAFGARDPKLVQLTSLNIFRQHNINPVPGLQVTIDGALATIRSVSGGRVTIDFNHPLAGKVVKFWIKIRRQITDLAEKIKTLCGQDTDVSVTDKTIEISVPKEIPEGVKELKVNQLKTFISEIQEKEIKFIIKEAKKEKQAKKKADV
ncbi:MAG: peptidylprolyl isomerase, partial [Candidatus Nanoarchaeia archaeon]